VIDEVVFGNSTTLWAQLRRQDTNLFIRAEIFTVAGGNTPVELHVLPHIGHGRHALEWEPPSTGDFLVVFAVYESDPGEVLYPAAATASSLYLDLATKTVRCVEASEAIDNDAIAAAVRDVALSSAATGSLGAAIRILLGLGGRVNARFDNFVYDANRFPTSFRARVFADAATAEASTPGAAGAEGATDVVQVTASPNGSVPTKPQWLLGRST
jgi:hypothetical protein